MVIQEYLGNFLNERELIIVGLSDWWLGTTVISLNHRFLREVMGDETAEQFKWLV